MWFCLSLSLSLSISFFLVRPCMPCLSKIDLGRFQFDNGFIASLALLFFFPCNCSPNSCSVCSESVINHYILLSSSSDLSFVETFIEVVRWCERSGSTLEARKLRWLWSRSWRGALFSDTITRNRSSSWVRLRRRNRKQIYHQKSILCCLKLTR